MKAEIKFDCKYCIDDISIEVEIIGKRMPTFQELREKASEQGWSIGRDCYCPQCFSALPAYCSTCEHFEGNKSMGTCKCRLDGKFTTFDDYCNHHVPV